MQKSLSQIMSCEVEGGGGARQPSFPALRQGSQPSEDWALVYLARNLGPLGLQWDCPSCFPRSSASGAKDKISESPKPNPHQVLQGILPFPGSYTLEKNVEH